MPDPADLPFPDFSARFRADLRRRPIFYVLSGPSLADTAPAIGAHVGLDPMVGTQNEIAGVMAVLEPLGRPLDIWMNIKTPQDVTDWRIFLELLDNPATGLILTPYAWMAHSHLMELEREFVIRRFHKVIAMDLEMQMLITRLRVNDQVNSLTFFLFLAHLLEAKGPIFLFGCDGADAGGKVAGYEADDAFGTSGREHLFYDHLDAERTVGLIAAETKGLNENWPVFEAWFERRGVRRVPIYNVGGAGHVTAFEIIGPDDIPAKAAACDADFDAGARLLSSGEHWESASLAANVARYDHFCGQFPVSQVLRRVIPYLTDATGAVNRSKEETLEALNTVQKLLLRLGGG